MDDLISRKAAVETVKKLLYETAFNSCGHHQDDEIYADIAEHRIDVWLGLVPSIPAVLLEPLAEWLAEYAVPPVSDCLLTTEARTAAWKAVLNKFVEEQDATD